MIIVDYLRAGLKTNYFVVKVAYINPATGAVIVGLNKCLETKLSLDNVASILRGYMKDSYKLSIREVEGKKSLPDGYYESFSIDEVASAISRVRFVKYDTVEVPKVVYVAKTTKTEL